MRKTPTLADIHEAELKLSLSLEDTRESLVRGQESTRKGLARVTTLTVLAGIAGLSILWLLTRRSRNVVVSTAGDVARTTSVLGLVLAFLLRYGRYGMPFILRQIRAAQLHSPRAKPNSLSRYTTFYPAATDAPY